MNCWICDKPINDKNFSIFEIMVWRDKVILPSGYEHNKCKKDKEKVNKRLNELYIGLTNR